MKLLFTLFLLFALTGTKAQKGFFEVIVLYSTTSADSIDSPARDSAFEVVVVNMEQDAIPSPPFSASAFLSILPVSKKGFGTQNFTSYLKAHTTSYTLTFLSGMASGMRDVCLFHFNNGDSWWNGKTSWKRKYKNGDYVQGPAFWGSTGIFVAVTDGPHFFNMLDTEFSSFALATAPAGSKKIGRVIRDALIYTGIRLVGRVVVYNGFFNPKNY